MRKYRLIAKKGEGTFSEVLKAQNIHDNKCSAIKCMKNHFDSIEQVNNLREIQALRRLSPHPHIVTLEEVLYDQPSGRLALVFELMDANLYELIRGRRHYLKTELVRSLMYQLVKSLEHMHNKGIFHRDIKPENILVHNSTELKLADFGSCRGIYSKQPYTEYISTRWYRAPECLLTDGFYGPEMDLWGVGCVFFEITSLYPLFPGTNELDQIQRVHKILGTPSPDIVDVFRKKGGAAHLDFNFAHEDGTELQKLIPHASPDAIDLMKKMLSYDPSKRINAREALRHAYFKESRELEASLSKQQGSTESVHPSNASKNLSTHPLSINDKLSSSNPSSKDKKGVDSMNSGVPAHPRVVQPKQTTEHALPHISSSSSNSTTSLAHSTPASSTKISPTSKKGSSMKHPGMTAKVSTLRSHQHLNQQQQHLNQQQQQQQHHSQGLNHFKKDTSPSEKHSSLPPIMSQVSSTTSQANVFPPGKSTFKKKPSNNLSHHLHHHPSTHGGLNATAALGGETKSSFGSEKSSVASVASVYGKGGTHNKYEKYDKYDKYDSYKSVTKKKPHPKLYG